MAEYIDREVAKKTLGDAHFKNYGNAIMVIMDIPTADVRPVVRGKWRLGGYGQVSDAAVKWYDQFLQGGFFYCSACKERSAVKTKFCPNCGAMMEKS